MHAAWNSIRAPLIARNSYSDCGRSRVRGARKPCSFKMYSSRKEPRSVSVSVCPPRHSFSITDIKLMNTFSSISLFSLRHWGPLVTPRHHRCQHEWLALLLRILEVPDKNLGPETGYCDRLFAVSLSNLQANSATAGCTSN